MSTENTTPLVSDEMIKHLKKIASASAQLAAEGYENCGVDAAIRLVEDHNKTLVINEPTPQVQA